MLGRIVRSEDFERVLAHPARARSPHFALHFASGVPGRAGRRLLQTDRPIEAGSTNLSTDVEPSCQQLVDDCARGVAAALPGTQAWLGLVVPKRHARRAVTRTLIKRQIRCAAQRLDAAGSALAPGLWVVRLRAPFDRNAFASAASAALRRAARVEIDALLAAGGSRA